MWRVSVVSFIPVLPFRATRVSCAFASRGRAMTRRASVLLCVARQLVCQFLRVSLFLFVWLVGWFAFVSVRMRSKGCPEHGQTRGVTLELFMACHLPYRGSLARSETSVDFRREGGAAWGFLRNRTLSVAWWFAACYVPLTRGHPSTQR